MDAPSGRCAENGLGVQKEQHVMAKSGSTCTPTGTIKECSSRVAGVNEDGFVTAKQVHENVKAEHVNSKTGKRSTNNSRF